MNTPTFIKEYAFELDNDNMLLSELPSQSNDTWDSSGGVVGTVKVYYHQDGTRYKITRATGTWVIYDIGTGISRNKSVMISCNEGFKTNQFIQRDVSSSSFDISTGFTDNADSAQGIVCIGAKSLCTLYRKQAGTSWSFEAPCIIAGNLPSF